MAKNKKKKLSKDNDEVGISLYYMSTQQVTVKQISEAISSNTQYSVEVWPELGVIEIELGEKQSIDIMQMDETFGSGEDKAFLENNGIKRVFDIETSKTNVEAVKNIFSIVMKSYKGIICSDSEDFMPILMKA